jgi:iron complex outermembrane receptor protein
LAAFDLTQNNVLTPGPNPAFQVQTGQVNVKGAELEAKVALAEGLSLIAAYTYLDPEITKANDGTKGNEPSMVPNHMASMWADYAFAEGSGLGGLTVGGGVRYISETWGDAENTVRIPGYVLLDAMARYSIDNHWDMQVNATNLLDKQYVSTCYYGNCYYGDGRRVLASLKYKW